MQAQNDFDRRWAERKRAAATKCKSSLSYLPSLGSDWGLGTSDWELVARD